MAALSISLLGTFRAFLGQEPLTHFRTNKVQALLVYLVVEAERAHRRDALATLLWPGLPESSARTNLRQILYQLRKAIPRLDSEIGSGRVRFVISERQTVRVNPDAAIELDVARFDSLIQESIIHEHPNRLTCTACQARLEEAVEIYQGDFLSDFYLDDSNLFEDWAQAKRESWRGKMLDALDVLAAIQMNQSRYVKAQAYARRQLEIDNLNERAVRSLMEALARNDQRSDALAVYKNCRSQLQRELGVAPTDRTTWLYQQIRDDELGQARAPASDIRGYQLLDEIASGAFGLVYRAYQVSVGREVAVKVIQPRFANRPDFIRNFEVEAQAIARLEHPHIVPLYDFWREPDGAYLVMRWLRGGSLAEKLANGAWPLESAVRLIGQISSALALAHRRGVIHRDIKPANILLDEAGNAYLSDFGIARDLISDSGGQHDGQPEKSSAYLSPEVLLNEEVSPLADQYSLGMILYEMILGESAAPPGPNSRRSVVEDFKPLPQLNERLPEIPHEVGAVIRKATARQPDERYADILEFASVFRETVAGSVEPAYLPVEEARPDSDPPNPYKGLRAFQEEDSERYFGREALIRRMVNQCGSGRFLAVVGPSGSGKSSAVRAGLLPALRSGAVPGSENWYFALMTPGSYPLEELEAALLSVAVNSPPSLLEPMERDARGLARVLKRILPVDNRAEGPAQLLLVIDQFEELFTLVPDGSRRRWFLENLLSAVQEPHSRLRVVLTLRADYYDRPLQLPELGELIRDHSEIILPLTPAELEEAISKPAEQVGVQLEKGLAAAIIGDLADQAGPLPLLQFALTELFDRRKGRAITHRDYVEIGGVRGALVRRAEELYLSLDEQGKEAARQLFLRLVWLGERQETSRRRVPLSEFRSSGALEEDQAMSPESSLSLFGRYRLLTFDHDPGTREPVVELAHEALIREWERLHEWLEQSRSDLRLQQLLAHEAGVWEKAGQDPGYLPRGARLLQFESFARKTDLTLAPLERSYLKAGLQARADRENREEARRQRELETIQQLADAERLRAEEQALAAGRLHRRAVYLGAAALIAILFALAAWQFARLAREQTALTESRELSLAALTNLDQDPDLSLLLSLEALEKTYTREAEEALHRALQASRSLVRMDHGAPAFGAAYSPDSRYVATAGNDGTVSIWEAASGTQVHQVPYPGVEYLSRTLRFDPSGQELVMISVGAGFRSVIFNVWSVESGEVLRQKELPIRVERFSMVLSPDFSLIAAGREAGTVELWGVEEERNLLTFTGHEGIARGVAFNAAGTQLATTSQNGQAFVWDIPGSLEAGGGLAVAAFETSRDEALFNPYFDPSGNFLALQFEYTLELWQLDDLSGPHSVMEGHMDFTEQVAFDPAGGRLASASHDGTARVWDLRSGNQRFVLTGHSGSVTRLAFSPDGSELATSSMDGTLRTWNVGNLSGGELLTFTARPDPFDMDLSPDGSKIAMGNRDGPAGVWDAVTGERLLTLPGEAGTAVYQVAFHPAGDRIAAGGEDGTVRIWDIATGSLVLSFEGNTGGLSSGLSGILGLAYSPGGERLATAGSDGLARVWDAETGREQMMLAGHNTGILAMAFSPDGRYIAASGDTHSTINNYETTLIVWDTRSGETVHVFDSVPDQAWFLIFSPDSRRLSASGPGGYLKVWDVRTGREVFEISDQPDRLSAAAFTPDGAHLVTGSPAGIRVWDLASGEELLQISGENSFLIALSGDARKLYAVDRLTGVVRVYYVSLMDAIALAQDRVTRDLTDAECQQYLHVMACP